MPIPGLSNSSALPASLRLAPKSIYFNETGILLGGTAIAARIPRTGVGGIRRSIVERQRITGIVRPKWPQVKGKVVFGEVLAGKVFSNSEHADLAIAQNCKQADMRATGRSSPWGSHDERPCEGTNILLWVRVRGDDTGIGWFTPLICCANWNRNLHLNESRAALLNCSLPLSNKVGSFLNKVHSAVLERRTVPFR